MKRGKGGNKEGGEREKINSGFLQISLLSSPKNALFID
jgi:hypothetical protein